MNIFFKRMLKFNLLLCTLLCLTLSYLANSFAQEEEAILEEIRWIQEEAIITIATKHETSISRAPGIATVITANQIKQMGFRTLVDVLKIVPGIDVTMSTSGTRRIAVRGTGFQNSERVRVLIDGHAVNDPFWGGAMNNFDDLVVENIKRIEVIRGPGSALYGKNAFAGVVNVVTKDIDDIDGIQLTVSGGEFDTQNYNMLFGKEYGDLEVSGFFDFFDTQGFSRKVEQDNLFPASFSMSPGRSHNQKEKLDLNLKLSYKNLEIKGKYMKKRRDAYIGIDSSLTDDNAIKDTYIFTELVYNSLSLGEKLNMIPKVYYDQYNYDTLFEIRPNGFTSSGFVYPDGYTGRALAKERTLGFENQFNYNVFDGNRLTFGFQYEWIHQSDVRSSEYTFDPSNSFLPISPPTDFSDTHPFTRDRATRQIWSVYAQDEWNITDDIDLTVGVRHDNFTRFGGTTNPRFGLVWRFVENAHLKFLFGTAFRAPNFRELFLKNQPVILGNSSLDPENINTYEFEVGYNFTKHIRGNIDFFFIRSRDIIVLKPSSTSGVEQYQNGGGNRIKGIEMELRAEFGKDNYTYANYTYQDAEETRNRNRLPNVPVHKANLGVNMGFGEHVNTHLNTFITGPRPREDGDTRKDLPSHILANLTLIGKNFMDNFEIRSSVFNLFDKGYDDPAGIDGVPTDYPQPGRSFVVELRYKF